MYKVIINADDFGLTNAVTYGICDCIKYGVVTSTSIISNTQGFKVARELIASGLDADFGVHLNITTGYPITNITNDNLINSKGQFLKYSEFKIEKQNKETLELIKNEWEAQILKILGAGIGISHLDSHHHMHLLYPELTKIAYDLCRKYDLSIRIDDYNVKSSDVPNDITSNLGFFHNFDELICKNNGELPLNDYYQRCLEFVGYDNFEIMVHPGYIDDELHYYSSMVEKRVIVCEALMHSKFAEFCKEGKEIDLTTYKSLKETK